MEPSDENFCYQNHKMFHSIFNGNIPSLIIKLHISQIFESPSKNSEIMEVSTIFEEGKNSVHNENLENMLREIKHQILESSPELFQWFEKVPVEALPIISGKKKILIDFEDLKSRFKKKTVQTLKSASHSNICSKNSCIDSEPYILRENQLLLEDLRNALTEIESQIQLKQMSEEMTMNTEFLQEISTESELTHLRKWQHSNGNVRNDEVNVECRNKLPETRPQNAEYLQEFPSLSKLDLLSETEDCPSSINQVIDLSFQNTEAIREDLDEESREIIKRIKDNASDWPTENTESRRNFSVEFQPIPFDETHIKSGSLNYTEHLQENENAHKITFLKKTEDNYENLSTKGGFQSMNEILYQNDLLYQSTDDLEEIHLEFVTGKRKRQAISEEVEHPVKKMMHQISQPQFAKTELLKDVSFKSSISSSKKRKKRIYYADFKNTVKKIKKQCRPEMQMSPSAVQIMSDILLHLQDLFEEELHNMKKVNKVKTLTENQIEIAIKFFLPKRLSLQAAQYGRIAVKEACRKIEKYFPTCKISHLK